jgi:hypothetical protein
MNIVQSKSITRLSGLWSGESVPLNDTTGGSTKWTRFHLLFSPEGGETSTVNIEGRGLSIWNGTSTPFIINGTVDLDTFVVILSKQHTETYEKCVEYHGSLYPDAGMIEGDYDNGKVTLKYKGDLDKKPSQESLASINISYDDTRESVHYSNVVTRPKGIPLAVFEGSVSRSRDFITANPFLHGGKQPCNHPTVFGWNLSQCSACKIDLGDGRRRVEEAFSQTVEAEDLDRAKNVPHSTMLHRCGVRADWLIAFTYDHDCWEWETWKVMRDIIQPATSVCRCRYADLAPMQGYTGPASVFMSHCWGGVWGDLVLAAVSGARADRYVWIDLFAVRQWPGNKADLDFRSLIPKCRALIVAISPVQTLTTRLQSTKDIESYLSSPSGHDAKQKIAFFRLWCVVELDAAVNSNIPVVVKGGNAEKYDGEMGSYRYGRKGMTDMVTNLAHMVHIERSECAVHDDFVREMEIIKSQPGGILKVNSVLTGVVTGAVNTIAYSMNEVDAAVCGEYETLQFLCRDFAQGTSDPTRVAGCTSLARGVLRSAAGGGRAGVLEQILSFPDARVEIDGSRALWLASYGGHTASVALLLQDGADLNILGPRNKTPFFVACEKGFVDIVQLFLIGPPEVDINKKSADGYTPFLAACRNGHLSVANILLKSPDVDLDASDSDGGTAIQAASFFATAFQDHSWEAFTSALANAGADTTTQWKGRGEPSPPSKGRQCDKGHGLSWFLVPHQCFTCDICTRPAEKLNCTFHGCAICDWDMCDACWTSRGSQDSHTTT